MTIGNQYVQDDKFKAAARLHQAKYRAEVLKVDFNEYGNRLCDVDEFYSITLFPDGNTHFHKELLRYKSLLTIEARGHVFGCTFEKFIASIDGSSGFLAWKEWLERRYVV